MYIIYYNMLTKMCLNVNILNARKEDGLIWQIK